MNVARIALALGLALGLSLGLSSAAFASAPAAKAAPTQATVATSTATPAVAAKTTVKASTKAEISEHRAPAAEQLLDVAERQQADLIVAGAYGHSRVQEWVFGGFTRALLAQTRRAVLFSH